MSKIKPVILSKTAVFFGAFGLVLYELYPLRGEVTVPMIVIATLAASLVSCAV